MLLYSSLRTLLSFKFGSRGLFDPIIFCQSCKKTRFIVIEHFSQFGFLQSILNSVIGGKMSSEQVLNVTIGLFPDITLLSLEVNKTYLLPQVKQIFFIVICCSFLFRGLFSHKIKLRWNETPVGILMWIEVIIRILSSC